MKKILIGSLLSLFSICLAANASTIPVFKNLSLTKDAVFLLSTPKSGTNVTSATLGIITRKPISWLNWGLTVFDPSFKRSEHPSYNRLKLPLITDLPLLYRSHYDFAKLRQIPTDKNKLIFVTRNPKELLYRKFFLLKSGDKDPNTLFIVDFLDTYLESFYIYENWASENKRLVYYEDLIVYQDKILLELLEFMGEKPSFYEDYIAHKKEYMDRLMDSYAKQHKHNSGGVSSRNGSKAIYYSKEASPEVLTYIDEYFKTSAPTIWNSYLKRFKYK